MNDPVHELLTALHTKFDEERAMLHRKVDAVVAVCHHFLTRIDPMSKAHDDLLALAHEADSNVDAVIAEKSSGDESLADITAVVTGIRDKAAAATSARAAQTDQPGNGQ